LSVKPHAFVAMPFGTKPGPDGKPVDFNRVYSELIRPALESAGLTAFRADEETRPGDIRVDMFQELLIADLVVVDLTIDNPNVWYELGVRHALRARGVVLISAGHAVKAFDVYTDRKLRYSLSGGQPDPATLELDRERLSRMIRDSMESWHGRKMSPVYQLIPNLREPEWRKLRVGNFREFWDAYEAWEARVVNARRRGRVGDMLLLADEAPVAAFRASAWVRAGKALRKAGHYGFALEQLEKGLEIDPKNIDGLRQKGICMQRLAAQGDPQYTTDMVRSHYLGMLQTWPQDVETMALLGRIEKDIWTTAWRPTEFTSEERREEAAYQSNLLSAAVDCYLRAFKVDPKHYYSGINALTLMFLYHHLLPGKDRYIKTMAILAGAVRFSAECQRDGEDAFWAKASLGDLEVLVGDPGSVEEAYKEAVAVRSTDWFSLNACRSQLELLQQLEFSPDNVDTGLAVLDRAMRRASAPEEWKPRRVFLFSGHMVDAPDRPEARFPESMVPAAKDSVMGILRHLDAGPEDLALTQGACGGDLLFSEACQELGVRLFWMQPFHEPEFLQRSVVRCGEGWRQRYLDVRNRIDQTRKDRGSKKFRQPLMFAPQELGDPPPYVEASYPYERCNRWLLYTALAWGVEKVHFICLWNGSGGDGPGGTAHMYHEVAKRTGQVHWIDTRKL